MRKGFPCQSGTVAPWKEAKKKDAGQQRRNPEAQATGHITGEVKGAKHDL